MHKVLLLILSAALMAPASSPAQPSQVAADIDRVFTYTHGFDRASWAEISAQEIVSRMKASPAAYIVEIESRIVFPDDDSLAMYPALMNDNNWAGFISLLEFMALRALDKTEIVAALVRLHDEVTADIDLMHEALANNPPADSTTLKRALSTAELFYTQIIARLGALKDPIVLQEAMDRFESFSYLTQGFIRGYSLKATGSFPPE